MISLFLGLIRFRQKNMRQFDIFGLDRARIRPGSYCNTLPNIYLVTGREYRGQRRHQGGVQRVPGLGGQARPGAQAPRTPGLHSQPGNILPAYLHQPPSLSLTVGHCLPFLASFSRPVQFPWRKLEKVMLLSHNVKMVESIVMPVYCRIYYINIECR